jgi:hypothetical protein
VRFAAPAPLLADPPQLPFWGVPEQLRSERTTRVLSRGIRSEAEGRNARPHTVALVRRRAGQAGAGARRGKAMASPRGRLRRPPPLAEICENGLPRLTKRTL